jgi:hypothetical protein
MPARVLRRRRFQREFQQLGLEMSAVWAPALDGAKIPVELRYLNLCETTHRNVIRPGTWACYASHLAILRESHDVCPRCDVVVFEDDVVFAGDFRRRWESFWKSLPQDWDMIRLGGDALWMPPFQETKDYLRVRRLSNTWGYIVRASSVSRLADMLAAIPFNCLNAIDVILTRGMATYVPPFPLVATDSTCHDTEQAVPEGSSCETDISAMGLALLRKRRAWPHGYLRSWCKGEGVLGADKAMQQLCANITSLACCPYRHAEVIDTTV